MTRPLEDLTPKEIVEELDRYIIGQNNAKRAVAIALRNRTRRRKLDPDLRDEVAPKNIIMIGPTGVGKTEIARRLSKLTGAPFLKVEATKYTEVGYVGRDVESMVRDLIGVAVNMVKQEMQEGVREEAERRTEDALLDLLLPGSRPDESATSGDSEKPSADQNTPVPPDGGTPTGSRTRERFRDMLRSGSLEEKEVDVTVSKQQFPAIEIFSGSNYEEMDLNLPNFGNLLGGGRRRKKRTTVARARQIILAEEMDKLVDSERVSEIARERTEQMGIIFIDEIDKVSGKENRGGSIDVSREGVQRDILPIVEGSQVNTKHGVVNTAHILFIAAGAFHMSKPSDLIPELQGRFPIRVELDALTGDDFKRILTQPQNALTRQYVELMRTEGVELEFADEAIDELSRIAAEVNAKTENIGARRLHTILERLLEDVSFNATELAGVTIPVTREYVRERLADVVEDQDLSRYIL